MFGIDAVGSVSTVRTVGYATAHMHYTRSIEIVIGLLR